MAVNEEKGIVSRVIAIIGHKFFIDRPLEGKARGLQQVEFNILWQDQFTFLPYDKFISFNLVGKFVKDQKNDALSKKYQELKAARALLAVVNNDRTVKWVLANQVSCQKALQDYVDKIDEDNFIEVDDFDVGDQRKRFYHNYSKINY